MYIVHDLIRPAERKVDLYMFTVFQFTDLCTDVCKTEPLLIPDFLLVF